MKGCIEAKREEDSARCGTDGRRDNPGECEIRYTPLHACCRGVSGAFVATDLNLRDRRIDGEKKREGERVRERKEERKKV